MNKKDALRGSGMIIAFRDYWSGRMFYMIGVAWGVNVFFHSYGLVKHLTPKADYAWMLFSIAAAVTLFAVPVAFHRVRWIRSVLSRGEIITGRVVAKQVEGYRGNPPGRLECHYVLDKRAFSTKITVGSQVGDYEIGQELQLLVDRDNPKKSVILAMYQDVINEGRAKSTSPGRRV